MSPWVVDPVCGVSAVRGKGHETCSNGRGGRCGRCTCERGAFPDGSETAGLREGAISGWAAKSRLALEAGRMPGVEFAGLVVLSALAAFVGAVSGFGFALLLTPPVSFIVGAKEAVVLVNVLGTAQSGGMFVLLRRHVPWRRVAPLALVAFAGMPVGLLVASLLPARALSIVIACTVLAATVVLLYGQALPLRGRAGGWVSAFGSGVLNTSTSMNGPPMVLYLTNEGVEPHAFRATLAAFFAASSLFGLTLYLIAGQVDAEVMERVLIGLPGLVIGWFGGSFVVARVSRARFRRLVLGLLFLSATLLLIRALVD